MLTLDLTGGASWDDILIIMISAAILGAVLSLTFMFTHRKKVYEKSFVATLILLPVVISIIILLVNNNLDTALGTAFSLAGVFALVRFRTAMADSRDITYILSTVAIALAAAMGALGYAMLITAMISLIFIILYFLKIDAEKTKYSKLQIVIAENLNYTEAFNDIFEKYLDHFELQRVKTIDFGSLFELTYIVKLNKDLDQKLFIDDLRARNSNLNITLVHDYAALMTNTPNN
ncbi:DUF4956 domain-containing protein [Acholeplasma equirhinis]|uniref:DUF4956 domain-containing protein n=1 Tax=Acholeplasma equirhinis TaxID=555393 RepID=UPI00197AFBC6|nr:DUF4956 domain-containing protein [Acholeplasma equirhinis]MBN3490982.1 DUF4956 domain-containing protein [Acholeplasma equirhinis]